MKLLTDSDLKIGDIILSKNNGFASWVIKLFDGGNYSHAGIYIGKKDGEHMTIESTWSNNGVKYCTLEDTIESNSELIVKRLDKYPDDIQPVIDKAIEYIDLEYDAPQIIQVGLICITWKLKKSNYFIIKVIQYLIKKAAVAVLKLNPNDDEKLVCSEFVYNSYHYAIPNNNYDKYTIQLSEDERLSAFQNNKIRGVKSVDEIKQNLNLNSNGSLFANIYGNSDNLNLGFNSKKETYEHYKKLNDIVENFSNEERDTEKELNSLDKYLKHLNDSTLNAELNKDANSQEEIEKELEYLFDNIENETIFTELNNKYKNKELTQKDKNDLKLSLDSFTDNIKNRNTILEVRKIKGLSTYGETSYFEDNDYLNNYIKIFGKFVTTRDLKEAENLILIGKLK